MSANKDTHIIVTHGEINAGWVNGDSLRAWGYQKLGTKIVQAKEIIVPNQKVTENPIAANALSIEFDLKAGDIGYYAFGTTMAKNTNLNVTPKFTSNPSLYDAEARNTLGYDFESFQRDYHNLVSDCVVSKGETMEYGLLSVSLGHGSPEEMQQMDVFAGTGNNDAADVAMTGLESQNLAKFQRWQMRCGKNDDALIKFKANRDTHLTVVWRKEAEITSWATHTALKSYAIDTDGFLMLDESKLCVNEGHGQIDDTYYNYDVHLKEGQSFLICYTSMGANYGVIAYDFLATAKVEEYDAEKVFNFDEAKALYNYCNNKIAELKAIVDALNIDDYSLVNWAYIDEAYTKFVNEAKEATTYIQIDVCFDEAKTRIESIQTLSEEAEALNSAKTEAINDVKAYLESKKAEMSDANKAKADELYAAFVVTVNKATSVSKINIEVTRIKAQIDQLCDGGSGSEKDQDKRSGCGGSVIASCALISVCALLGASTLIIKKRKGE